ncbi:MAG: hypothetical protein H5T68_01445 [Chloroflexi bacterium]|nr:hypothetical protein [Chloroflexota bacterium]
MNAIPWLLEPNNPSVRYLALRHLLELPEDDADVQTTRSAIPGSPIAAHIFARQAPGGYWGDPTSPYLPKYKSTYWTLILLGHLGLNYEDQRVQRAVEYIFQFQQPEGGFAEYGEEGARREHSYVANRKRARGQEPPNEKTFVADLVHQMTLSCLTGNMVATLLRLGYNDDSRLWQAADWLVSIQHSDGGWLCPYWKAHIHDKHSCFHGTICALEGLAEIPPHRRSPQVLAALARGSEFLLMHRLYRSDHHNWQVINPRWLELAFPWFGGYSLLRGLWVLTKLEVSDKRMDDALTILRKKRRSDGRWMLERAPNPTHAILEKKGQPSKWVTLKALEVLQSTW